MEELENVVRKYLVDHDRSRIRIGGYDVLAENGQIRLGEAPVVDVNQLLLPLHLKNDGKISEAGR